jgi:ketosteroid isomerase-like protein
MSRKPADAAAQANAATVARFYGALARRDAERMIACYAPDAEFSDPMFPRLDRDGVAAMWRMLCERGHDLVVTASNIRARDDEATAAWLAVYTYGATGRRVENRIVARFSFRDGRIVRHVDRFDLMRWARQALGPAGTILALPGFRTVLRRRAAAMLARYRGRDARTATA